MQFANIVSERRGTPTCGINRKTSQWLGARENLVQHTHVAVDFQCPRMSAQRTRRRRWLRLGIYDPNRQTASAKLYGSRQSNRAGANHKYVQSGGPSVGQS